MAGKNKSRGRPSTINDEVLAILKNAYKAGLNDTEACAMAEISKDALYRYQRANPNFASEKAAWKKLLIGHAKMVVAVDIITHKNVKTAQWALERESEHEKAAVQRLKAETKRIKAEADIAEVEATIAKQGNSIPKLTVVDSWKPDDGGDDT